MDPRDWKAFEQLVAAIHDTTSQHSVVNWNETIGGRQFDVTIRFPNGLYQFLIVIECKASKERVPVKEVEAFITKAADVQANKAVIASTAGFQDGCRDVAERHGLSLLTITETIDISEDLLSPQSTEVLSIWNVRFKREGKPDCVLEDRNGKLHWLINEIVVVHDKGWATLYQIMDALIRKRESSITTAAETISHIFEKPVEVHFPEGELVIAAVSLSFDVCVKVARELSGPAVEPSSVGRAFEIRDELARTVKKVAAKGLNTAIGGPPVPGNFYNSVSLGYSYYCSQVVGDLVHWILVESYQHGKFIQAEFTQKVEHTSNYARIHSKQEVARLKRMLKKLQPGKRR